MHWGAGGHRRPAIAAADGAPHRTGLRPGCRNRWAPRSSALWVRIGVDHATLGNRWFFRGFVDGIVPTYVPDHADAVRIECIDSSG